MRASDIKHHAGVAALACLVGFLYAGPIKAQPQIVCPSSATELVAAAPILGPLNGPEPWSELHGESLPKNSDGSLVNRYDLDEGDSPGLEKWLICHYRDGSYKAVKLPISIKECRIANKFSENSQATDAPPLQVLNISCN